MSSPAEELFDPGPEVDIDELILGQLFGPIRPLDERDHRLLQLHGPDKSGMSEIQNLRAGHHTLARMVAMGLRQIDIADETGYSMARISHLVTHSGAFQELVEHYRHQITDAVVSHHSKIHFAAGVAVQLVTEELVDNSEALTPEFKLKAMKELLEHSGYAAASQTKVDMFHHQGLSAAEILELKKKVHANDPRYVEATNLGPAGPDEGTGPAPGDPSSLGAEISEGNAGDLGSGVGGGMAGEPSPCSPSPADDPEAT